MQTQPMENIDAVLGRFQAWAGARNAVEARAGVRELSDEEALRSGRYRWKGVGEGAARKKPTAEPVTERVKTDARRGATKRLSAKRHTEAKSGTRKAGLELRTASAAKKITKAAPEFREALAEAVRPAEVLVAAAAQPMEAARQLAISVRLAPAERALIRIRAAEAGITTSAYIRQCALEVEQLRAQVREVIAAMERGGAAPVRASGAAPGFFSRLARRFFPRREPVLALRA